ncbi:DUF6336 family protein [Streptomyces tibetensis]|uniref:DUF6336 family protein n=1 Tax=Streptomyces tibetensis TaxID=2382123 RepID=UPI0033F84A1F
MRELASLPASAVRRRVPFCGNAITRPLLRMRDVVARGALYGLAAVPQLGVASLFVGDHAVQPGSPCLARPVGSPQRTRSWLAGEGPKRDNGTEITPELGEGLRLYMC